MKDFDATAAEFVDDDPSRPSDSRARGDNFSLLCEASKTICAHSEAKAVFLRPVEVLIVAGLEGRNIAYLSLHR